MKFILILLTIFFSTFVYSEEQQYEIIENDSIGQILEFYGDNFNKFYSKEKGEKYIKSIFNNFIKDDYSIEQIENTELFKIVVNNKDYFMIAGSSFIFSGNVIKLDVNDKDFSRYKISDNKRTLNRSVLRTFDLNDLIKYEHTSDRKRGSVIIFSDYSCPYCKKFHDYNLDKVLSSGYDVFYAPYLKNPRNLKVKDKMRQIYCYQDNLYKKELKNLAFENTKLFNSTKFKTCDYSEEYLDIIFSIGEYLGVRGTPTTVFYNGNSLSGFIQLNQYMAEVKGNN